MADDRRLTILSRQMQRVDFVTKVEGFDPDTGEATMSFVPDPRRYTEKRDSCGTLYVDKFTRMAFRLGDLVQGFDQERGLPMYGVSPRISDTGAYAQERFEAVRRELLTGEQILPSTAPASQRTFDNVFERPITFVSIDICGATALRAEHGDLFDRAFDIFMQELATVVGQFEASILKTTGDGFIAYVDHPSITARDNALDMALSLLAVLQRTVNPALHEFGLPALSARVGADDGPARVRAIRVAATGYETTDVVSDALNRAVKIQEVAKRDTVLVGEALYSQLHVGWLERCVEVQRCVPEAVGVPGYRCFEVR